MEIASPGRTREHLQRAPVCKSPYQRWYGMIDSHCFTNEKSFEPDDYSHKSLISSRLVMISAHLSFHSSYIISK